MTSAIPALAASLSQLSVSPPPGIRRDPSRLLAKIISAMDAPLIKKRNLAFQKLVAEFKHTFPDARLLADIVIHYAKNSDVPSNDRIVEVRKKRFEMLHTQCPEEFDEVALVYMISNQLLHLIPPACFADPNVPRRALGHLLSVMSDQYFTGTFLPKIWPTLEPHCTPYIEALTKTKKMSATPRIRTIQALLAWKLSIRTSRDYADLVLAIDTNQLPTKPFLRALQFNTMHQLTHTASEQTPEALKINDYLRTMQQLIESALRSNILAEENRIQNLHRHIINEIFTAPPELHYQKAFAYHVDGVSGYRSDPGNYTPLPPFIIKKDCIVHIMNAMMAHSSDGFWTQRLSITCPRDPAQSAHFSTTIEYSTASPSKPSLAMPERFSSFVKKFTVLQSLPYITRIESSFYNTVTHKLNVTTPLYDSQLIAIPTFSLGNPKDFAQAVILCLDILRGMNALHTHNMAHGTINAYTVFLQNVSGMIRAYLGNFMWTQQLTDAGSVHPDQIAPITDEYGTLAHSPPELFLRFATDPRTQNCIMAVDGLRRIFQRLHLNRAAPGAHAQFSKDLCALREQYRSVYDLNDVLVTMATQIATSVRTTRDVTASINNCCKLKNALAMMYNDPKFATAESLRYPTPGSSLKEADKWALGLLMHFIYTHQFAHMLGEDIDSHPEADEIHDLYTAMKTRMNDHVREIAATPALQSAAVLRAALENVYTQVIHPLTSERATDRPTCAQAYERLRSILTSIIGALSAEERRNFEPILKEFSTF